MGGRGMICDHSCDERNEIHMGDAGKARLPKDCLDSHHITCVMGCAII